LRRYGLTLILLVFCTATFARAESLRLNDGSVVTGEFQQLLAGNVIFKTDSVGTLTIPATKVESFESKDTVVVVLKGGKTTDGIFSITAAGVWQLQSAKGITKLQPDDVAAVYPFEVYMKNNPDRTRMPWQDWKGQGTLGYVLQESSQNSRSLSVNFISSRVEPTLPGMSPHQATHFSLNMAFATVTESGVTTKANTLTSVLRQDFFIGGNARNYLFGQGEWDHIQPQDLSLRQTYGGGLGRDLIRRASFTFSAQGGLTYVRTVFGTGEVRNEMDGLAGERILWNLAKHLKINHEFDVYPSITSAGDYRFSTLTALDAPISDRFSFNISLNDQYLNNPLPGTKANVLILSTGLGIKF
jgi:putative salt-induced outer membrane protein YdiY